MGKHSPGTMNVVALGPGCEVMSEVVVFLVFLVFHVPLVSK